MEPFFLHVKMQDAKVKEAKLIDAGLDPATFSAHQLWEHCETDVITNYTNRPEIWPAGEN